MEQTSEEKPHNQGTAYQPLFEIAKSSRRAIVTTNDNFKGAQQ